MSKFTPWFVPDTKPCRCGVYQTKPFWGKGTRIFYQHWNGEFWGYYATNKRDARVISASKSQYQKPRWRGLAEQPEQPK